MNNLFLMMTFPLFFIACSATQPNIAYDHYKAPSDLFRELGFEYRKGSFYEYNGVNFRKHERHFKAYCNAKDGIWSAEEKTIVTPRKIESGFLKHNLKNDVSRIWVGNCVVSDESFFKIQDYVFVKGKAVAIDGIAKKEYEAKLKEKGQSW